MKEKKPCIRNLPAFKKGCPENDACPCWIEMAVTVRENNTEKQKVKKMCLDIWMFQLAYSANALLEGNQEAIETFRNNTHESAVNMLAMVQAKSKFSGNSIGNLPSVDRQKTQELPE